MLHVCCHTGLHFFFFILPASKILWMTPPPPPPPIFNIRYLCSLHSYHWRLSLCGLAQISIHDSHNLIGSCGTLMRVGWKVHRLTTEELCHSNETGHALDSTSPDTNYIVSFQINLHWMSNSGLWKVEDTFREQPEKLMKVVLFHQDNAPAHKSVVAMAAMHDCGFKLGPVLSKLIFDYKSQKSTITPKNQS